MDIATGATTPVTHFSDTQTLFDFAIDRNGRMAWCEERRTTTSCWFDGNDAPIVAALDAVA
jgi:hypothetical protein